MTRIRRIFADQSVKKSAAIRLIRPIRGLSLSRVHKLIGVHPDDA